MPDSYLNDVPGVKDVRIRGGSLLPRRNVLEIEGARVYDDAVLGQTVIDIAPPWVVRVINIAAFPDEDPDQFVCPNSNADLYRFFGIADLIGLGAPAAGDRRKVWIVNADTSLLGVFHEDTDAPAAERIVTRDGNTLVLAANGGSCLVAYIASRWRVIG